MRLRQDLEAVAHAKDGTSLPGELFERAHHLREAGDGARSQVVTIREPTGNDNGINTLEVSVRVPQLDRLAPRPLHAVQRVAVAIGAWEYCYSYSHSALPAVGSRE